MPLRIANGENSIVAAITIAKNGRRLTWSICLLARRFSRRSRPGDAFALGSASQVKLAAAVAAIRAQYDLRTLGGSQRLLLGRVSKFLRADAQPCSHLAPLTKKAPHCCEAFRVSDQAEA